MSSTCKKKLKKFLITYRQGLELVLEPSLKEIMLIFIACNLKKIHIITGKGCGTGTSTGTGTGTSTWTGTGNGCGTCTC